MNTVTKHNKEGLLILHCLILTQHHPGPTSPVLQYQLWVEICRCGNFSSKDHKSKTGR